MDSRHSKPSDAAIPPKSGDVNLTDKNTDAGITQWLGRAPVGKESKHKQEDRYAVGVLKDNYLELDESQKKEAAFRAVRALSHQVIDWTRQEAETKYPQRVAAGQIDPKKKPPETEIPFMMNSVLTKAGQAGTTLCAAIVESTQVTSLTVGDGSVLACTFYPNGKVDLELINKEQHNFENPNEVDRVKAFYFEKYKTTEKDESKAKEKADHRMQRCLESKRLGGGFGSGLLVSRALGDLGYEGDGLSHDPNLATYSAPKKGRTFIIVSSDGLTEKMSLVEAQMYLQKINYKDVSAENINQALSSAPYHEDHMEIIKRMDNGTLVTIEIDKKKKQQPTVKALVVLDGHGGDDVSEFVSHRIISQLQHAVDMQPYYPIFSQIVEMLFSSDNLLAWDKIESQKKGLFHQSPVVIFDKTKYFVPKEIQKMLVLIDPYREGDDLLGILKEIKSIADAATKKHDKYSQKIDFASMDNQQVATLFSENKSYQLLCLALSRSLATLETDEKKCIANLNEIFSAQQQKIFKMSAK